MRSPRLPILPYHEIAVRVLSPYTEGIIERDALAAMCREAYDFELPLEPVAGMDRVHCLRLDRGPTASFKDFAAQMMARLVRTVPSRSRTPRDHPYRDQRRYRLRCRTCVS